MNDEDELDRMRARKKRGNAKNHSQPASRGNRSYYSQGDGRNPRSRYTDQKSNQKKHSQKRRKKKNKRRLFLFKIICLIILLLGAFFVFKQRTHQKGFWTIAIFGVDSRDGKLDKGALSDVIMLCNINKATGEIKLVSVYRDTYLKINKKGTFHKINEAYFKGGHKQGIEALNENLDLNIDDYATFNWKSVADAINILGGIDLEITDSEFAYINGFITETVNSTGIGSYQLKHAGMNHLDGVQAVAYARLRLMDTDYNRTERQRKVVNLAMEKAKNADFATRSTLVSAVFPQVSTSIGVDDILPIMKGISKYHIGETAGFPFSRTSMRIGRMDCVVATTLESNVVQLQQFLYDLTDYTPSGTVKSISARIAKETGLSEPGKNAPTGGGSGSKKKKASSAPKETPVQETSSSEEIKEETAPETTSTETEGIDPETTKQEPANAATNDDGSLIGPGAHIKETDESKKEKSNETMQSRETPAESSEVPVQEVVGPGGF